MDDLLFTRDDIVANLTAVADLLDAQGSSQKALIVVGGSFLALQGFRRSTADVDTLTRIDESLRRAVDTIASREGLRTDWLNDSARPFAPVGLKVEDCEVLLEHRALRVLGPPPDFIFLMKLYAARAPDYDDLVALWPYCSFGTADEAVSRYRAAYPHETDEDPHLVEYVQRIADTPRGQSAPVR